MSNAAATPAILPRPMLAGLMLLLAVTVAGVALERWSVAAQGSQPLQDALTERVLLRFSDAANGAVQVAQADSGAEIATFAPGTNHFARGLLRGIGRERRKSGIDMTLPLELGKNQAGQLALVDPLTQNTIVMAAFGTTNAAVFEDLYQTAVTAQQRRIR